MRDLVCVCTAVFKLFNSNCSVYMAEMFSTCVQENKSGNSTRKLSQPSYLGHSIWNSIGTRGVGWVGFGVDCPQI